MMPKKGYKQTEEHKRSSSIAHKNLHSSVETEFKAGKGHRGYIDGRSLKKYYCMDCGKELKSHSYCVKRCRSCATKELWKDSDYNSKVGKKISKAKKEKWQNSEYRENARKKLHKHHIDLDGNDERVLFLTNSKHRKLHEKAYDYLVEIGRIDEYLVWFEERSYTKVNEIKGE